MNYYRHDDKDDWLYSLYIFLFILLAVMARKL